MVPVLRAYWGGLTMEVGVAPGDSPMQLAGFRSAVQPALPKEEEGERRKWW